MLGFKPEPFTMLLSGSHWIAKHAVQGLGHSFEIRKSGDDHIGLWKIRLHKNKSLQFPRRFILIPGFGDTPLSWIGVLGLLYRAFKEKYDEIVLFDFPGFRGYLAAQKCVPSMDLLMKLVSDALDSLRPNAVFGHSLGGWLAAHYFIELHKQQRPAPEKLVLLSPSGVCGSHENWEAWNNVFNRAMAGEINLKNFLFAKEPWWFRWFVPNDFNYMTRDDVVRFVKSIREEHILQNNLHVIDSQVCLIWGEEDKLIPVVWAKEWVKELAQDKTQTFYLKSVGHTPQIEAPRVLAKTIANLLSS